MATLLADGGLGKLGGDIGVNSFLDNGDDEVAVFEFSGLPDTVTHGGVTVFETPKIQVQCRSSSNAAAWNRCYAIYQFLSGKMDQTVNLHVYTYIQPSKYPHLLSRKPDLNNRVIHMAEFEIQRRPE